eukprot:CAMPEP_0174840522 /NCGR_PEP_ID=MMETSP1114-20130205/8735_1 /TAXON_ID=312471 /ORGANISM="Neobodo designis, Strain CCAP 1951/1" /LENGTH=583 /DNA_ID=CAMNT_0016074675 /DNA_START=32 /DNA_END=1783 /DNA_ORIENTATION=+
MAASGFETPPRTPTKARLSATSLEASSYLLSPTARRSGGGPVASALANAGAGRLSGTRSTPGAMDSPFGRGSGVLRDFQPATPDRTPLKGPGDRFIPERDVASAGISRFYLDGGQENALAAAAAGRTSGGASPGTPIGASSRRTPMRGTPAVAGSGSSSPLFAEPYVAALTERVFNNPNSPAGYDDDPASGPPTGVLPFHRAARGDRSESFRYERSRAVIYEGNRRRNFVSKGFRVIPQTPDRILDAPDLVDDFYLNLLDWSDRNVLAVALSNALYLWQADTGEIKQLMSGGARTNIITSVAWNRGGGSLAVGMHDATASVYDPETSQPTARFDGHTGRIGAMSWNGDVLATASRDSTIRLYDVRRPNCIGVYQGHTQEVCGLKWSPNGTQLASGGNDNLLNVWDFNRQSRECSPTLVATQHSAAVKALAWNPVQSGVLASGGGTADKTLKFWDVRAGELINSVDTRSQVCGAVWNRDGTEIVTSHGYSDNQLTIWKYPSLTKVADLTGHSSRVLHLAASPNGETVVSAAGDETIRFWRCFAPPPAADSHDAASSSPIAPSRGSRVRPRPLDDPPEFELEAFR